MTEEIREILEYYQKDIDKFEYYMSDYNDEQLKTTFSKNYQRYKNHKILLNYITNLQKENENLFYEINGYLEEKEKLKEKINKLEDYKLKNEKAFELLQLLHYKFADGNSIHHDIEDIQKELQGGDK